MFSKLLCCVAILCSVTIGAWAQPTDAFTTVGVGAQSCGKYIDVRSKRSESPESVLQESIMISWAQGYISAMNADRAIYTKKELMLLPDPPSIEAYLDKFCRENPLKKISGGTLKLYIELEVNSR